MKRTSLYNKKIQILWDEKICLSCHSNWTHKRCFQWIDDWNSTFQTEHKIDIIKDKKKRKRISTKLSFKLLSEWLKDKRYKLDGSLLNELDGSDHHEGKLSITVKRSYALVFLKKAKRTGLIAQTIATKMRLANVKVTENCMLCGICSEFCPTGALLLNNNKQKVTLTFNPQYCINCDICENSCLEIKKGPIKFEELNIIKIIKE